MKVLVVGGGSGGHITPAVSTIRELIEISPRARIEFWTDRKYYKNVLKLVTLGEAAEEFHGKVAESGKKTVRPVKVRKILAGKFRRYSGWSFLDYFRNFKITVVDLIFKNILGFFGFLGGFIQSFIRLAFTGKTGKFDVVFLKGGFVGLPVGMAAKILKIPYVIHESDATPGLANRILMRGAKVVATGSSFKSPEFEKKYRIKGRAEFTGTPVGEEFKKISQSKEKSLKRAFSFDPEKPLVIITGGSQGAKHINEAVKKILPELLKFTSVGLVAGRKQYEELVELKKYEIWEDAKLKSNFRMWEFNSTMDELMGAADLVVSRAGATTIAELAALSKAVILVPFEKLPGGHQVKNAEKLEAEGAAVVIRDEKMVKKPEILLEEIKTLIKSPKKREALAKELSSMAKIDAARRLAEILVEVSKTGKTERKPNLSFGASTRASNSGKQG